MSQETITTGGPAFPTNPTPTQPGMSLLDFFAAHALGGLLANPTKSGDVNIGGVPYNYNQAAYLIARGMIGERERLGLQ